MGVNETPKMTISIAKIKKEDFMASWREMALLCGFQSKEQGDISKLLVAIANLPESDRILLVELLKRLLTDKSARANIDS